MDEDLDVSQFSLHSASNDQLLIIDGGQKKGPQPSPIADPTVIALSWLVSWLLEKKVTTQQLKYIKNWDLTSDF